MQITNSSPISNKLINVVISERNDQLIVNMIVSLFWLQIVCTIIQLFYL